MTGVRADPKATIVACKICHSTSFWARHNEREHELVWICHGCGQEFMRLKTEEKETQP